jgi:lipoate-protein ligase B
VSNLSWSWIGRVPYGHAWELQRRLVEARRHGQCPDLMLLLEHAPVYTFGRRGRPEHLLLDPAALARLGAEVVWSDRGGDVTYHGPGQLVGYPICDLARWDGDIPLYVRRLEGVMIGLANVHGVGAGRIPGLSGAWVGEDKLGAVGVKVSAGVTSHGFAFNADPNLEHFEHIVACGLPNKGVTSLRRLGVRPVPTPRQLAPEAAQLLAAALGLGATRVPTARMRAIAREAPAPPPVPSPPSRALADESERPPLYRRLTQAGVATLTPLG